MKKIVCIFAVTAFSLGLTASAAVFAAKGDDTGVCSTAGKCNACSDVVVTEGAVRMYGDGLVTAVYSAEREGSHITIEYPVEGNPALVSAIRKWIDYGGVAAPSPAAQIRKQLISLTEVEGFNGPVMEEYVDDIKVIYSDSKVVSYLCEGYVYGGGAHPMSWRTGATFSVATGEMLTADYLPPIASMRPLIIKGLQAWADTPLEEWTFNADGLRTGIEYGMPVITADGLKLLYAAYEIAPYSSGQPESLIPLPSFRNMLPAAASIFF